MPSLALRPVIAVGAIHSDTIAHAFEPIRPETSTPSRLQMRPGGVATNVARALVRLGVETTLVGTIGDDAAGASMLSQLEEEGIRPQCVVRPGFPTGQYLALHDPDGTLTAACVDDRVLAEAPADLLDPVLEELAATTPADTIWFLDANLPASLLAGLMDRIGTAAAIANAVSDAKAARLAPHLRQLHCLMLNRGEASALTGLPPQSEPEALARALEALGLRRCILTNGASGALLLEDRALRAYSAPPVRIMDVTGAGDALTAGTIAAMARGYSLSAALPYGLSAAAHTLSAIGALAEDLSWQALEKY